MSNMEFNSVFRFLGNSRMDVRTVLFENYFDLANIKDSDNSSSDDPCNDIWTLISLLIWTIMAGSVRTCCVPACGKTRKYCYIEYLSIEMSAE